MPERITLASDVALFAPNKAGTLHVLLVRRGWDPDKGKFALPGGKVEPGEWSLDAAVRELAEETTVEVPAKSLTQVGAWDKPGRDARGRFVAIVYTATLPRMVPATAADDAVEAVWVPVKVAIGMDLAFDHKDILLATLRLLGLGGTR
ncbi:NUDIX domain-containing protein [Amycolatopsis sp. DSM 110486]|uniref:NUDIX domain-containing protein n=1 Tax=Amycolatopsis sp. DSM 110486 TaxID=2865832 RepID=UPI001C6A7FCB|nr:NUDIX domain-containing protein [Amycolatopsis sp. DSM 110486]QYN17558.1 NUDIX domain-containing protein [Amycolatopsis sp. DSM 110486]